MVRNYKCIAHHKQYHLAQQEKKKALARTLLEDESNSSLGSQGHSKKLRTSEASLETSFPNTQQDSSGTSLVEHLEGTTELGREGCRLSQASFVKLFCDRKNSGYFFHDSKGTGTSYLLSMSQHHTFDMGTRLDPLEVSLHTSAAALCDSLPRGCLELIAKLIDSTVLLTEKRQATLFANKCAIKHKGSTVHGNTYKALPMAIPRCVYDLRRYYVTGKDAVLQNLPSPKVFNLGEHSYIKLVDCVKDLLAHGTAIDNLWKHGSDDKEEADQQPPPPTFENRAGLVNWGN
jgi:hypothetical protein